MEIRKDVLAGSWYPGTKDTLSDSIDAFFAKAASDPKKANVRNSRKIIVPHAGHVYSGLCAAYGYEALSGNITKALILCPSHRAFITDIALSSDEAFQTPLGLVPVDTDCVQELSQSRFFSINDDAHFDEHAIEIQLPFLQKRFPGIQIIPLIVGHLREEHLREAAKELLEVVDERTAVIISTDFTHYGANFDYLPFRDHIRENLAKLDGEGIECILRKDTKGFLAYIKRTGATICGRNPIAMLLDMLGEDEEGSLLQYYTSGDVTGDFNHSVSYASLAFR